MEVQLGVIKKKNTLTFMDKKSPKNYKEYVKRQLTHFIWAISNVALGDYSVRARYEKEDELASLALGINMMIEEIQKREKELEKAMASLEEKVKERTEELQEKLADLERFQRLAVGRELKMVELKEEIKKLKKELAEK